MKYLYWIEDRDDPSFETTWSVTTSRRKVMKTLKKDKEIFPNRKLVIRRSSKESYGQWARRAAKPQFNP
jgi:hypothetical protein